MWSLLFDLYAFVMTFLRMHYSLHLHFYTDYYCEKDKTRYSKLRPQNLFFFWTSILLTNNDSCVIIAFVRPNWPCRMSVQHRNGDFQHRVRHEIQSAACLFSCIWLTSQWLWNCVSFLSFGIIVGCYCLFKIIV